MAPGEGLGSLDAGLCMRMLRKDRDDKMPTKNEFGREAELLEKLVLLDLYSTQSQIARFMGKSKTWVNDMLKGLPKKAGRNGSGE
jgi:hypothetical protein